MPRAVGKGAPRHADSRAPRPGRRRRTRQTAGARASPRRGWARRRAAARATRGASITTLRQTRPRTWFRQARVGRASDTVSLLARAYTARPRSHRRRRLVEAVRAPLPLLCGQALAGPAYAQPQHGVDRHLQQAIKIDIFDPLDHNQVAPRVLSDDLRGPNRPMKIRGDRDPPSGGSGVVLYLARSVVTSSMIDRLRSASALESPSPTAGRGGRPVSVPSSSHHSEPSRARRAASFISRPALALARPLEPPRRRRLLVARLGEVVLGEGAPQRRRQPSAAAVAGNCWPACSVSSSVSLLRSK